jgi:pimeloyl-ACP methyl ester carboxylesterase
MDYTTRIGEVDVAWEDHGRGPETLVLVHGFTGARIDFEDHLEGLSESRRVIAADHRGHGDSTNFGTTEAYSLDILADDLLSFLETVTDAPVDLLGHSMGGMVALRCALLRPEMFRSLVLMDTAAESLGGDGLPSGLDRLVRSQGLLAMNRKMPPLPESQRMRELYGDAWFEENQESRLTRMDPEAFIALFPEVFGGPSLLERLGEVRMPTTVLVGAEDTAFAGPSAHLAEGIPGARLVRIDGAWHSPQRTHPERWRSILETHLREYPA